MLDAIRLVIGRLDENEILSNKTKDDMAKSLARFNLDSIQKFISGQKEHGGLLQDRDLEKEIHNEIIDLFWYNSANKWK